MALFREHISVGAVVAGGIVVAAYNYGYMQDPMMLTTLFALTTIASFAPDLDSDSGLPFHLLFGTFTIACASAVFYYVLQTHVQDWRYVIGIPLGALAVIWFIGGAIFKHFTEHRGMMHSIPAALIAGLLTYLAALYVGVGIIFSGILSVAVVIGYVTHLILDEIHSSFSLGGIPFIPKRSLGTAIKFFAPHAPVKNMATYVLLAWLVYISLGTLS